MYKRLKGTAVLACAALLAACAPTIVPRAAPPPQAKPQHVATAQQRPRIEPRSQQHQPAVPDAPPKVQRPTAPPTARPAQVSPALANAIRTLGSGFSGNVGIAVRDVHADWLVEWNGRRAMPQQSVSKLWVAITLLDAIDKGRLSLDSEIVIRPEDLTLFHQPIRQLVGVDGYRTTVRSLLDRAMTQSDNTANDALMRRAGGPEAVRGFLIRNGIPDVRFGPGERLLQAGTAGLKWNQSYSRGNAFYTARANLPLATRTAALERYLADPPDGATAVGIVNALAKLKRGEMLSSDATEYLLDVMRRSKTGPQRLKGGLAADWLFAHKTGTGQELGGRSTGYNDIALLTAPDGRTYAVAVLIAETRRPIPERMRLMQAVTRAIIANHKP